VTAIAFAASPASAADRIRLAVQKTGTLAWELEIMKAHGLDKKANLDIQTLELATPEAGKIAIKGGSVDMFLSDWLWAARERSLGDSLVFYPSSSTVGAVMTKADSPIKSIADLKGKKLAVAGGPLDKSWLLLQGLARRGGLDLRKDSTLVYGAPPLLSQKALQGENDGTLTFWNFCAELEGQGMKRAIVMDDVMKSLGAQGAVAILGFVFDNKFAEKNRSAVDRFFGAIREAKEILGNSEGEWQRLAPRIGVSDPKGLTIYRERYREGIPRRAIAEEEADARGLYRVLADVGGTDLVGMAKELDKGTFYKPATVH
jgi:NitT/TauT family transport system substrate-binding protein